MLRQGFMGEVHKNYRCCQTVTLGNTEITGSCLEAENEGRLNREEFNVPVMQSAPFERIGQNMGPGFQFFWCTKKPLTSLSRCCSSKYIFQVLFPDELDWNVSVTWAYDRSNLAKRADKLGLHSSATFSIIMWGTLFNISSSTRSILWPSFLYKR